MAALVQVLVDEPVHGVGQVQVLLAARRPLAFGLAAASDPESP